MFRAGSLPWKAAFLFHSVFIMIQKNKVCLRKHL